MISSRSQAVLQEFATDIRDLPGDRLGIVQDIVNQLNTLNLSRVIAVADPGTGVAIPVTRSAVINMTVAGTETNTLAPPAFDGQKLILNVAVLTSGTRAITASAAINQAGNTIMTFGAARDAIVLEAIRVGTDLRWLVTGNDGVALS